MDASALEELGWSPHWQARFQPYADSVDVVPARVVRSDRGSALVATPAGVVRAKPAVRLLKASPGEVDLPVVGDWVAVRTSPDLDVPLIDAVLARTSAITRGDPGQKSDVQALAANIDIVFVVHPIAEPPNLRRVERELSLAWESGAAPVALLTKADLSSDPDGARAAVESIALGVDVCLVNGLERESVDQLLRYISGHRTAVLIGPSGAGKSTLINALLGEDRQATRAVRVSDGRGRHTTVARELIRIAGHGVVIDTPGLRALGLTGSQAGIAATFADIEELAGDCRFRDCTHEAEPGCAVRAAVESGALAPERLASYHKLVREARHAAGKKDARLRAEQERRWKIISKSVKRYYKRKDRG